MESVCEFLRIQRIKSRVWVTTSDKSNFALVSRWALIRGVFSRKDVYLRG